MSTTSNIDQTVDCASPTFSVMAGETRSPSPGPRTKPSVMNRIIPPPRQPASSPAAHQQPLATRPERATEPDHVRGADRQAARAGEIPAQNGIDTRQPPPSIHAPAPSSKRFGARADDPYLARRERSRPRARPAIIRRLLEHRARSSGSHRAWLALGLGGI